jgi:hypothetical protein
MKKSQLFAVAMCAGVLAAPLAYAACPGGAYCASIQTQPSLASFCGGTVPVTVTNTGTLTWTAGGANPFHLSYHWLQGANTVVVNGTRTNLPNDVAPGGSVTLSAEVARPPSSAAGTYTLQFDMVEESVTWFAWQGSPVANVNVSLLSLVACMGHAPAPRVGFGTAPKITSCDFPPGGGTPVPWPGSAIHCTGTGFGSAPGRVMMNGLKTWNGTASDTKLITDKNSWTDTDLIAYVPDGLSGFRSQPVMIQVWVQGGLSSNEVPGTFEPTIDVEPMDDSAIHATTCAGTNNTNTCGCGGSMSWPFESTMSNNCFAGHYGDLSGNVPGPWNWVNGDAGTDDWTSSVSLRNGWTYGLDFSPDQSYPQQTRIRRFIQDSPNLTLMVIWSYDFGTPTAGIDYNFQIYRQGPLGVPSQ